MSRFRPPALSLVCALSIALPAVEVPDHPLADQVDAVLIIDQQAVLAGAAATMPTSLWADPAFAKQRAHIEGQLRIMLAGVPEAPPLLELLRHGGRTYVVARIPAPDPEVGGDFPVLTVMEAGAAAGDLRSWLQRELLLPEETGDAAQAEAQDADAQADADADAQQAEDALTASATSTTRIALGGEGTVVAIGDEQLIAAWEAAGAMLPAPGDAVAVSRVGFGPVFAALARIAELDDQTALAMELLFGPDWRQRAPVIATRTQVDAAAGWRSRVLIGGLERLPLRTLGSGLAPRLPASPDILLALAIEPAEVARQVVGWLALEQGVETEEAAAQLDDLLRAATGIDLERAVATLTGEAAIAVAWAPDAMPFPKGALVLGVRDGDTAAAVLNQLLATVEPLPAEVAGAHMAWSVTVPMQQLTIAVGADAVVIANRPDLAAQALAGRAEAVVPWPDGSAAYAEVALRSIGERWLPMGLAQLAMVDEPIGVDPLAGLRNARWQIGQHLQAEPAPTTVAAAFFGPGGPQEQEWLRDQLARLVPGEIEAGLEERIAIWKVEADPELEGMAPEVTLVLRTAGGFRLIEDWNEVVEAPDAATARAHLDGYVRVLGPTMEELVPVVLPQRPTFDRRWLPSAPLAVNHLPLGYSLVLKAEADGRWTLDELGLPLLANYAHSAGLIAATVTPMLGWQLQHLEHERRAGEMRERHAGVIGVLEQVAPAIEQLHANGELPPKASHLAAAGHLTLADAAPLFGGQVPTAATALDRVGRWQAAPDGWPQAVWAIHLEPGWAAYVTPWGEVDLAEDQLEVEPTPADAATAPPPAAEEEAAPADDF